MKYIKEFFGLVIVIGIILLFVDLSMQGAKDIASSKNDLKIKAFTQNKKLECRGGFERFIVSKKKDWKLDKAQFVKGDKVVSIIDCNLKDK